MNTREIAAEYRLAHWAGIMRERTESGMSIKAYCEAAGCHENVYYYWQRRLREAASQELLPATQGYTEKMITPAGWAVCGVSKSEPKGNGVTIEIGKCRIIADAETDAELLSKVCKALIALC